MRKLLLGLIGLLFAVPGWTTNLPSGYTELEYIQSTGTQYIDTNFMFTGNKGRVDVEYMQTTTQTSSRLFGYWITKQNNSLALRLDNGFYRLWVGTTELYTDNSIASTINVKHSVSNVFDSGNCKITFDGVEHTNTYEASISQSNQTCYLFAMKYSENAYGNVSAKIYSCKIYDGDTLARNYVPARRNSDNVLGMYDLVSGQFFTNAGTGEFIAGPEIQIKIATTAYNSARFSPVVTELNDTIATIRDVVTNTINQTKAIADLQATKQTRPDENCPAGKKCLLVEDNDGQPHWYEIIESASRLPDGFTELQYIESTGTQYIDLGRKIRSDYTYKIKMAWTRLGSYTFMSSKESSDWQVGKYLGITFYGANEKVWYQRGSTLTSPAAPTKFYPSVNTVNTINWKPSTNKFMFNGVEYTGAGSGSAQTTDVFETANNMYLFAANSAGTATGMDYVKLYSWQMYDTDGTTLLMNLIPAKDSSNVIGMYDTVSGQFFTNAGTGTFDAGPEI